MKPYFSVFSGRISIAIVLLLFILGGFFISSFLVNEVGGYKELKEIEGKELTFDEYADFFENLAEEKGGKYAFDALRVAELAPRTDFHLLGHVVGDVLYKQKGVEGMSDCTHDFRNACSHSIVTGVFTEYGLDGLESITKACEDAPGSKGAYSMCFHGMGHGVLAYALYDLEKAVSLCREVGDFVSKDREEIECVGGAIMEIVGGGDHDKIAWERERPKFLKDEDPLYPCNSSFMTEKARGICYIYLTPHLLKLAGFDFVNPDESIFPKAFDFCNEIPEENKEERYSCYGGFGKEFFGFVNNGDVRNIGSISYDDASLVAKWCNMAENELDRRSCLLQALTSLFWGGESKVDAAFKFCELLEDKGQQTLCYSELAGQIEYYSVNTYESKELCNDLPDPHKKRCIASLP